MNIQSQHPSLAPFLSPSGAKQLLPNHIAADPLWPSPFILICQKPLWTSHLLPVTSKIWQMSQNLCVCLRPVCENHALSNPWNCETWTNIPVPKQHKWNDKKMNVQQRHLQTLQTKLKKRASVTRYLGLNKSSIVPSVLGAEAWGGHLILEQLPLFLSCWRCKFCWHWTPEPPSLSLVP